MDGCPEPLEQIFQKVEEESERRAQQARLDDLDSVSVEKVANAATAKRQKEKRRGSISISRIGQRTKLVSDDYVTKDQVSRSPSVLAFAPNTQFYQSHIANLSTNSIASGASQFSNAGAHTEDDNHVTQMHHIVGKPSISSKIIPRRLSRSKSASVMAPPGTQNMEANVVIGISIQEAVVESVHEEQDGERVATRSRSASVVARGPIQKQQSQSTLGSRLQKSNWLSMAKSFTQKIRRKNKVAPLAA
ncbi:hypothetical protein BDN70DRAFT_894937 [Pholiota conissans]|uniref:Uncharacterized protein n=1 Tax=Pholiota conissans TaxID=109636 RepID=A0A9P5Z1N4_9AGAR|nr:hypothetical protein BDN70DRAFT_894937 [Pholiota conissans]